MVQKFEAVRTLTPGESETVGAVELAKQMAFREAMHAAQDAYQGQESLPQDHSVDEAVAPTDEGGTEIRVIITLPD